MTTGEAQVRPAKQKSTSSQARRDPLSSMNRSLLERPASRYSFFGAIILPRFAAMSPQRPIDPEDERAIRVLRPSQSDQQVARSAQCGGSSAPRGGEERVRQKRLDVCPDS